MVNVNPWRNTHNMLASAEELGNETFTLPIITFYSGFSFCSHTHILH